MLERCVALLLEGAGPALDLLGCHGSHLLYRVEAPCYSLTVIRVGLLAGGLLLAACDPGAAKRGQEVERILVAPAGDMKVLIRLTRACVVQRF